MNLFSSRTVFAALFLALKATSLPQASFDTTVLKSTYGQGITISYKQTYDCETTPGVKSYAGYIHLPSSISTPYPQNIFFLFYESRKDPENAPLVLWLSGGPGESSTRAAYGENGPCIAQPDSTTVKLNPLSWNNAVNMLYLDQPVATGFSYDYLANGTSDKLSSSNDILPVGSFSNIPAQNATYLYGVFASQANTVNTTANAAPIMWTALQAWIQTFPGYTPVNDKISLWMQSYGGLYAAAFATLFEAQNVKIKAGLLQGARTLSVDSVGVINGYIDMAVQILSYPEFAYNKNTYDVQRITKSAYKKALAVYPHCMLYIAKCRITASVRDSNNTGGDTTTNSACMSALEYCFNDMQIVPYSDNGFNFYDIARTTYQSQWPRYATGYLNQAAVQRSLGVPLNYTDSSEIVGAAFLSTGDAMRGGYLEKYASLLDSGVKVALLYGDRDYQCNWLGGEKVSVAIPYCDQKRFAKAGYADFVSNGAVAGQVRQYNNLSFTRVYQAGHEVPYDQPRAAYDIFVRTVFGLDIASGSKVVTSTYATKGVGSVASIKSETCDAQTYDILQAGLGIIKDFLLVGYYGTDGKAVSL